MNWEDYKKQENEKLEKAEIRQSENEMAKLIAAVVRNSMEDFHCKHLSDAQMKELNPIT